MDVNEIEKFSELIKKAGNRVAMTVTDGIVDVYYDDLKDFPLDLIERAISYAYHDRNPEDDFLKTKMVSSLEIENAANRIVEEESQKEHAKCPKCDGLAWIIAERKDGKIIVHPCQCLYNKAIEMTTNKVQKYRVNNRFREIIIKSYEAHQK